MVSVLRRCYNWEKYHGGIGMNSNNLFLHDMIHNNPGLAIYESQYKDPAFFYSICYDSRAFHLHDRAQYGLLWDGLKGRCFSVEQKKTVDTEKKE